MDEDAMTERQRADALLELAFPRRAHLSERTNMPRVRIDRALDTDVGSDTIIYHEDATYMSVPLEEARAAVRRWRYYLERMLGLFNVNLHHACTVGCFRPLVPSPLSHSLYASYAAAPLSSLDDQQEQEGLHYVGVISSLYRVYGCPRSGCVHWCPGDKELRQQTCRILVEDRNGLTRCRFSGQVVGGTDMLYSPYSDTTIHMRHISSAEQVRVTRATEANTKSSSAPEETAIDRAERRRMTHNLAGYFRRRHAPAPVAPIQSPPRSPQKRLRSTSGGSNSLPGRSAKRARMDLPYNMSISQDAEKKIRTVVRDLLTDRATNTDLGRDPETSTLGSDQPDLLYFNYCIRRLCVIYALVDRERKADTQRRTTSRRGAKRGNRRQGGCQSTNVREVAVSGLYMYARGMNSDEENLIPPDERLAQLLPPPNQLMWYGLDEDMRRHLRDGNVEPPERIRHYQDIMHYRRLQQIQQAISGFTGGKIMLRRILEQ